MKKVRQSKKYKTLKNLSEEKFRRLTGVKRSTFKEMSSILLEAENQKKGGPRNKLGIADRLLLALEYLREYRTYFHIGESYGISESSAYKNCRWVEDVLIKSGRFSLPGRKQALKVDHEYQVILIDASESPIERPKKK